MTTEAKDTSSEREAITVTKSVRDVLIRQRASRGECETCGIQTHKIKMSLHGRTRKALSIDGCVLHGRCLLCNPINKSKVVQNMGNESSIHNDNQSNETNETNPFVENKDNQNELVVSDVEGSENISLKDETENKSLKDETENESLTKNEMKEMKNDSSLNESVSVRGDGIPVFIKVTNSKEEEIETQRESSKSLNPFEEKGDMTLSTKDDATYTVMTEDDETNDKSGKQSVESQLRCIQATTTSAREIVKILSRHQNNTSIQIAGCERLRQLERSLSNKKIILSCGAVPLLRSTVDKHPISEKNDDNNAEATKLFHATFSAICSLTCRNDSHKMLIIENDLMSIILRTMSLHADDEHVQEEGCHALHNLTFCSGHLIRLKHAYCNDVRPVLQSAKRLFPTTCAAIASIIEEKLNFSEMEAVDLIRCMDSTWEDVVFIMKELIRMPYVQRMGCVRLDIVAKIPDVDHEIITTAVLNAMKKHETDASLQALGCSALAKVCGTSKNVIEWMVVEEDVIKLVLEAMKLHDKEEAVQEYACDLLNYLVNSERGTKMFIDGKGKKLVKVAGKHFPEKCAKTSKEVLRLVSLYSDMIDPDENGKKSTTTKILSSFKAHMPIPRRSLVK